LHNIELVFDCFVMQLSPVASVADQRDGWFRALHWTILSCYILWYSQTEVYEPKVKLHSRSEKAQAYS